MAAPGGVVAKFAIAVVAALSAAAPVSALAHGGATEALLGDDVTRTADGLYRVAIPGGPSLLTHGPDPHARMDAFDLESAAPNALAERPPVCATDHYQHVLYGHLTTAPNLLALQRDAIVRTMRRSNALLNADAIASGGVSADYKVLCDERGEIRIDSFAAPGAAFDDIVAAAIGAGYAQPNADYTIFFDAPSAGCGIGSYRPDNRLSADNRSNEGGGYGIVYQGCWNGDAAMHENAHNQGAVQDDAPHSTGTGGHCFEERDVLCYSPDGGDRHQEGTIAQCTDRLVFDCGYDDYFDAAPEPGEYLAGHWNLGSALNRFIAFSAASPDAAPPPDAPCPRTDCAPPVSEEGQPRYGVAPRGGGWAIYGFRVNGRPRSVAVSIASVGAGEPAPQLDLYVRRRTAPSTRRWDCRSARAGSRELCRVRNPKRGSWYAGVRSKREHAGGTFTISVKASGAKNR